MKLKIPNIQLFFLRFARPVFASKKSLSVIVDILNRGSSE